MKLLIATSNTGKFSEFRELLRLPHVALVSLNDIPGLDPFQESGITFAENAREKAAHFHGLTGMPVVADDSGLEVELLGGAPGIHSARYAGAAASDHDRIEKLLQEIKQVSRESGALRSEAKAKRREPGSSATSTRLDKVRPLTAEEKFKQMESFEIGSVDVPKVPGYDVLSPARFVCALSYYDNGEEQFFCESECRGFIVSRPQGTGGFGYDPVFLVPEAEKTMAELTRAEKNELSHRGKAVRKLREFLAR
ncbi:MAG TPA: non-canonical purine NTP pyrophosphatase [Acidobacteriota bacterium]|jgi:XTP/dITP diphosphohydrolase